jgi:hypothetical protein
MVLKVGKEKSRRGRASQRIQAEREVRELHKRVEAVSLGAEKWHGRGCRHADRYIRTNE